MQDSETFLKTLPASPGVYRMYNANEELLYVGKAKQLKKRVSSYFRGNLSPKTASLMSQVEGIQITQTASEAEALLLECELIKRHLPRYNILLRDDKSFPYLVFTKHRFPRLAFYRGARKKGERYFGPYPNSRAARESMDILQRVFLLRDCSDSYFSHRTRPCLQYQIKRCSAPCVNYISDESYENDVRSAMRFLTGKGDDIIQKMTKKMNEAADAKRYEEAAKYRDQVASLREVQSTQVVSNQGVQDIDVFALAASNKLAVVDCLMIRGGHLLGDRYYYLKLEVENSEAEILESFLSQYYLSDNNLLPKAVVTSVTSEGLGLLFDVLQKMRGTSIKTFTRLTKEKQAWLEMAKKNAEFNLEQSQLKHLKNEEQFAALKAELGLDALKRIECFDISHQQGESTVASNVVFNESGPAKSDYRRYNIKDITAGDDYAAMRQALTRRFSNAEKTLPEVLIIDGGKGQIKAAYEVLVSLGLQEAMLLLSISKGKMRRFDQDTILRCKDGDIFVINLEDKSRLLLQYVRDESHRFAINAHQKSKTKRQTQSILDEIPGIGAKRKKAILQHFGGLRGLKGKGIADIEKVPGVSRALAELIFRTLQK